MILKKTMLIREVTEKRRKYCRLETDFELNRINKIIRNSQPTRISGVPPGVNFTAQNFTSGIFPNGSRAEVVIKFAAAS